MRLYKRGEEEEEGEAEDLRETKRRIKTLKLKKKELELKKTLEDLENELRGGKVAPPSASLVTYMVAQGMDAKKANEFIKGLDSESIAKLQLLSSSPTGQSALLPFLLVAKRPEVSTKDLLDLQGKYFDSALELAKESRKKGEGEGFVDLMREMLNEIREERKARMEDRIRDLESKIEESRFDPKEYVKSLREQAEALGFRRAEAGKVGELDLKLEEMRETHELKLSEMNLQLQKWMYEKELEDRKWNLISSFIGPGIAAAAPGLREAFRSLGRGRGGSRPAPTKPSTPREQPLESACWNCGEPITIQPPYPDEIKCKSCGELNKVIIELG